MRWRSGRASVRHQEKLAKVELLRRAYCEVLDATKHQDDKVGRLLTAAAFWTSGSLALLSFGAGDAIDADWQFHGESMGSLVAIVGVTYLILILVASSLLVSSIMTPLRIPTSRPSSAPQSQIYFQSIARESKNSWKSKWEDGSSTKLEGDQLSMYMAETRNLALRADHKYSRTTEAVAFLQVSLLALMLLVILSTSSLANGSQSGGRRTAELTNLSYWAVVATIAIWTLLQVGARALAASSSEDLSKAFPTLRASLSLAVTVILSGVAIYLGDKDLPWRLIFGALACASFWYGYKILRVPKSDDENAVEDEIAPPRSRATAHNVSLKVGATLLLFGQSMFVLFPSGRWPLLILMCMPTMLTLGAVVAPFAGEYGRYKELLSAR